MIIDIAIDRVKYSAYNTVSVYCTVKRKRKRGNKVRGEGEERADKWERLDGNRNVFACDVNDNSRT